METERNTVLKFLVFSDSHGSFFNMQEVFLRNRGTADGVFFLGDGLRDAALLEQLFIRPTAFYAVSGNCDSFLSAPTLTAPEYRVEEIEGFRFLLCHGHTFGVKSGLTGLLRFAEQTNADAVLYGHTHVPYCSRVRIGEKNVQIMCPGSISRPAEGLPSFGMIEIRQGVLFMHTAELEN